MSVQEKLKRYVMMDTTADEKSSSVPSTKGQMELAKLLQKELEAYGLETTLNEQGYLFGFLKNNTGKNLKKLGLLAHLDTSPDMSGKDVKPRIVRYEGGDLVLNADEKIIMKEAKKA